MVHVTRERTFSKTFGGVGRRVLWLALGGVMFPSDAGGGDVCRNAYACARIVPFETAAGVAFFSGDKVSWNDSFTDHLTWVG